MNMHLSDEQKDALKFSITQLNIEGNRNNDKRFFKVSESLESILRDDEDSYYQEMADAAREDWANEMED
ncbi:hypothetical protein PQ478_08795 [Alkalihalophilus pseudofirmus]|uniref:hypothetical protein n=1 Tax=Alkalihalophilus pseudofirmus TaxID=79885 RepID=UPI00259B8E2E|nr:hypothetical protein [Alkalihalophilus pseudofirmus]WEG18567.1 hypothetical protein PQ478_08795 [Alkalihalophilus pseudofirmus]